MLDDFGTVWPGLNCSIVTILYTTFWKIFITGSSSKLIDVTHQKFASHPLDVILGTKGYNIAQFVLAQSIKNVMASTSKRIRVGEARSEEQSMTIYDVSEPQGMTRGEESEVDPFPTNESNISRKVRT